MATSLASLLSLWLLTPSASALTGTQLLTFDDYAEQTEISTQYEGQGVIFREEEGFYPEIRWDGSSFTNPVLGGTFGFGSRISAQFVAPGTTTPAAVENLAMDLGFIDDPGSTELTVERTSGPFTLFANEYGFNHLALGANDITGFAVESEEGEDQGWEIDNLEFTIPAPPPACPRFKIVDSRGSGEKKGILSPPAEEFDIAFEGALGLYGQHTVATKANPYAAVSVFGWYPGDLLNGIGAIIHKRDLGAYHDSVHEGEVDLKRIIEGQLGGRCANRTKTILIGYSQGAQVTGNVFQNLSGANSRHVAAVVLFGDPLYDHGDRRADQGSRRLDGALGTRPAFRSSNSTQVLSYCNAKDPICQWRLPTATLARKRLSEHKKYWGSSSSPAEVAARKVAKFVSGR